MRLKKILDWFNGWCPKETLMSHPYPVSRSRERLIIIGQIAFFGSGLALVSLSLLITPIYPSDHEILVRMETIDQAWQTATENTVTFRSNPLSRLLTTYMVKITYNWDYDCEKGRVTKLTYSIYSNDEYVEEIHDSYDVRHCRGGGYFDPISLPLRTLRVGEDTVRVHISFNSTANEPRTRSDSFEFHIDSEVVTNNYRLTVIIVLLLALFVFIVARKGRGAGP